MDETPIKTRDGLTLYLITNATISYDFDGTAASVSGGWSVLQAFSVESWGVGNGRGWDDAPASAMWTKQTSDLPYASQAVAGFDATDAAAVDAAVEYIAEFERRRLADASARRALEKTERTSATAAIGRLDNKAAMKGDIGWKAVQQRKELHQLLIARGLLPFEEITALTGIATSHDDATGQGTQQPPIMYGRKEVAIRAGVQIGTVDRYRHEGRLPLEDQAGLWWPETIEAWLKARQ